MGSNVCHTDVENFVTGNTAIPKWLLTGTTARGERVRVRGCDFYSFRDGKTTRRIAEAVTRPTMRFVGVKSDKQSDLQSLHRSQDQLIGSRTRLYSRTRACCLEAGAAIHQRVGKLKANLPHVLATRENDLTRMMRRLLASLLEDLNRLKNGAFDYAQDRGYRSSE